MVSVVPWPTLFYLALYFVLTLAQKQKCSEKGYHPLLPCIIVSTNQTAKWGRLGNEDI